MGIFIVLFLISGDLFCCCFSPGRQWTLKGKKVCGCVIGSMGLLGVVVIVLLCWRVVKIQTRAAKASINLGLSRLR